MIKIDCISIQALCHATEDCERVLEALHRLYSTFEKRKAEGYFKNPIYVFEARITRRKEITHVLQVLKEQCSTQLSSDIERRMDEKGNLYIRVDKQELYQGSIVTKDDGEIKIIIHIQTYPSRVEDAIHYAEEVFSH